MAGSLGAFSMSNQCSVENLADQLKQKKNVGKVVARPDDDHGNGCMK